MKEEVFGFLTSASRTRNLWATSFDNLPHCSQVLVESKLVFPIGGAEGIGKPAFSWDSPWESLKVAQGNLM